MRLKRLLISLLLLLAVAAPGSAATLNDSWYSAFQMCGSTPCLQITHAAATGPLTGFNTLNDLMLQAFASCGSTSCLTVTLGSGGAVTTVPEGGTGVATMAAHGVLVGAGVSPVVVVGPGAVNSVLAGAGASADPAFTTTPTLAGLTLATTPLAATSGGSGFASYAVGDLLYASTTTALSKLVDVAAGSYLRSGGANTAPVWSTTTLPNSAAVGDLLYASASNVYSNLADVAAGSYLRSGGVTTAPVWSTVTLPNSSAIGDLLSVSATNVYANISAVASGSVLASAGTGTLPTWSPSPTLTTSLTTPLVIGGTTTTSPLTFKTTTGVGTTNADMIFQVGSNGGTEAMRILNSGLVGIGVSPAVGFHAKNTTTNPTAIIEGGTSTVRLQFVTANTTNNTHDVWAAISTAAPGNTNGVSLLRTTVTQTATLKGALAFWTNAGDSITEKLRLDSAGLMTFQGQTTSFPALKRSSADLQVRLGDDSGYTNIDALAYKASGAVGVSSTATVCKGVTCAAGDACTMIFVGGIRTGGTC